MSGSGYWLSHGTQLMGFGYLAHPPWASPRDHWASSQEEEIKLRTDLRKSIKTSLWDLVSEAPEQYLCCMLVSHRGQPWWMRTGTGFHLCMGNGRAILQKNISEGRCVNGHLGKIQPASPVQPILNPYDIKLLLTNSSRWIWDKQLVLCILPRMTWKGHVGG